MDSPDESDDAGEKNYENCFFHFVGDLKILAEDADIQCLMKRYDNVAWEIKEFSLSSAMALSTLYPMRLTHKQFNELRQIIMSLRGIPNEIVNVRNEKEEHLRVMKDDCWSAIRVRANQLLEELRSEIERVDAILWPD